MDGTPELFFGKAAVSVVREVPLCAFLPVGRGAHFFMAREETAQ